MITPTQMRAARAMLDVSQGYVAEFLGIAANTLSKIESGQSDASVSRINDIQKFYEREGIEFTDNDGVRWAKDQVYSYEGPDDFARFMDDVYETAQNMGGDFCVFNATPHHWLDLMGEKYNEHSKRMEALGDHINVKITCKKGVLNFISKAFATYKWVPDEMFNEKAFYAYGDKIAFINFNEKEIKKSRVLVFRHPDFAQGFKTLFNIAWDKVAKTPE